MHGVIGEIAPELGLKGLVVDLEVASGLPLFEVPTVSVEWLGAELLIDDTTAVLLMECAVEGVLRQCG